MTEQSIPRPRRVGYSRIAEDRVYYDWPPEERDHDPTAYEVRRVARGLGRFLREANGGLYLYRRRDRSLIPVLSNPGSAFFNLMLGLGYVGGEKMTHAIERIIANEDAPPLRLIIPGSDGKPRSTAIRSIKKKKTTGRTHRPRSKRLVR